MTRPLLYSFFQGDSEANEAFNADFREVSREYNSRQQRQLCMLIMDYKKIVPVWTYAVALKVLTISDMELQQQELNKQTRQKIGAGKEKINKYDTDALAALSRSIEMAKEQVGLDAKSLRAQGDGSINEAFSDLINNGMSFNPKRSITKVVLGLRKQTEEIQDNIGKFIDSDRDKLIEFIDHATAEN